MNLFLSLFLSSFFLNSIPPCNPEAHPPTTSQEQASAYDCRQKIRILANEIRAKVEKMVRERVEGIFQKIKALRKLYPIIDELERQALQCCQNGQSFDCCSRPLVEQMELWNSEGLK